MSIRRQAALAAVVLLLLFLGTVADAQLTKAAPSVADAVPIVPSFSLSFGDSVTYPIGTKNSALVDDFKIGPDGSVFLQLIDGVDAESRLTLIALTPSGGVVRYEHHVEGFRNLSAPTRFFASTSRVYALQTAEPIDPNDPSKNLGYVHLIQTYDYKGDWRHTTILKAGAEPVNFAVYGSNDILLVSVERFSQRATLTVVDDNGEELGQVSLSDSDYGAKLMTGATAEARLQALGKLLSLAQFVPRGDNLLLVPVMSRLPVLEINERGVVRETPLALPEGASIASLLPSTAGMLYARVGHVANDPYDGSVSESTVQRREKAVFVFNSIDGSLASRVEFSADAVPIGVVDGRYIFLASRPEDGRIQLVSATTSR